MEEPPYRKIVAEIRRRIDAGELRPGDRVPSARQITKDWDVAIATATKVLSALQRDGLVRSVPGVGTVVAALEPPPSADLERTARRHKPAAPEQELNLARVVRAAVGIADAEGLAGLSMRRVAGELGIATMSLYQHVSSKEELVQQMVGMVVGEVRFPEPPPPWWRARLELAARLQWASYRRHPWLAQVISFTRPPILPQVLVLAEWILSAMDGLGLDANTMLHIQVMLSNYVRGTAVNLEQEVQAVQDTGMTDKQWLDSEEADTTMAMALKSSQVPRFAELFAHSDLMISLDTLFEFGLGRLLDGVGVLIERRAVY